MPLSESETRELRYRADLVRAWVIKSVHTAKAGHIGGPLSMAEIVTALYFHVLRIDPACPHWPERDRFVLSKGHAAIGLYATLALRGYLPLAELATFDKLGSRLQAHPDMTALPGIDMSTGSLGQGLSAAVGMALGAKLKGAAFRTYALIGDGEAQEGQVWEAAAVAARYGLDNLLVIMDCNGLQQYGWAGADERRAPPQPAEVAERWRAFGWATSEIDGHDPAAIVAACETARAVAGRPSIVIARTRKGKGVSFMEGDYEWHARVPTDEEWQRARAEIMARWADRKEAPLWPH